MCEFLGPCGLRRIWRACDVKAFLFFFSCAGESLFGRRCDGLLEAGKLGSLTQFVLRSGDLVIDSSFRLVSCLKAGIRQASAIMCSQVAQEQEVGDV